MAKKKKVNHLKNDQLFKKQQKNRFLSKLEGLFKAISHSHIYTLIPKDAIEFLYNVRGRSVRVQAAKGQQVPKEMLEESKYIISRMLKEQIVPFLDEGLEMSLDDFYTVGFSLYAYYDQLRDEHYPAAKEVKEALSLFKNFDTIYKNASDHFNNIKDSIAWLNSSLDSRIYVFSYESLKNLDGKIGFAFGMEIYCQEAERIQVVLDNETRPVYRVGWQIQQPERGMEWTAIKADDLNLGDFFTGKIFDVYIQAHALKRLEDRIDCLNTGLLHIAVYTSLRNVKAIRNESGYFLFDYYISEIKVGYLLGELFENKIILKTFLFLTNDGTPEGKKLHESTKLLKEDKSYLAIDKLSTFIETDIGNNKRVKKIFVDAGCGGLFEMDHLMFVKPEDVRQKPIAKQIADYIGLKDEEIE